MNSFLAQSIYFLGPLLLAALVGRRVLGMPWRAFLTGLIGFLAAWFVMVAVTAVVAGADMPYGRPILYALIVSTTAGVCEESARYGAFRLVRSMPRTPSGGTMYAIGHSGMESMIVGGILLLTAFIVEHAPGILPDRVLADAQASLDAGFWLGVYAAVERVIVGLVIHASFTFVVLLAVRRSSWYLLVAMAWHFAHDCVAHAVGSLADQWLISRLWVLFIVVVYPIVAWRIVRVLARPR